jgi:5'-deoxynucleotidase
MNSHFFAYLFRLRYIERWSLMRNISRENVAEHSYHVSVLTHALCTIGNEVFGKQLPVDAIVSAALFHDVTEVITGDIPTPIKHHNPSMLNNFREIEQLAADQLVSMVPDALRNAYVPMLNPSSSTLTKEQLGYIKAADKLDAYLKCASEVSAGNREFSVAKAQLWDILMASDMPEIHYFLAHFAPSFEKTIDELNN